MVINTVKKYLKRLFRLDICLFITSVLVFLVWPSLDITIANAFYDQDTGKFPGDHNLVLYFFYRVFAFIHFPVLIGLIVFTVYFHHKSRFSLKKNCVFLLCCLLLGPGLLVNIVLKDNSIGRARPEQTALYGGDSRYTNAFEYSGECPKNCSFTSGHASIGFVLIAVAWVARRRDYFIAGCILGGLLGVMRIAQGAHFASDVLFSFWAVYFVSLSMARYFRLSISNSTSSTSYA